MSSPTVSFEQIQLTISSLKDITIEVQNLLISLQPVAKPVVKTFTKDVLLKKQLVLHADRTEVVWDYDYRSELPEGCKYACFSLADRMYEIYKIRVTLNDNKQIVFVKDITDDEVIIIAKGKIAGTVYYTNTVV